MYNEYGLKIISNNPALTSKNIQVVNYSLNADGTINFDSLPEDLQTVYKNLQDSVLDYYLSSEAGRTALDKLDGEANLKKIIDGAWQSRALSRSWGNGEVSMDGFVKEIFQVFEEMIRAIEIDSECLTRLTGNGFDTYNADGQWNNVTELASRCAELGKLNAEKLKGGGQTVDVNNYKFDLVQDANGFKKPADKYISSKTGIYFPNDTDVYTQYAFDTALARLKTYLGKMYPWLKEDNDLFTETFNLATNLAMWGLANNSDGNSMTISLEQYIQNVAKYFMAYINQDYRDGTEAQNVGKVVW